MVKWYGGANAVHQPEVESSACGRNELTSSPTVGTAQTIMSGDDGEVQARPGGAGRGSAGGDGRSASALARAGTGDCGHRIDSWARN